MFKVERNAKVSDINTLVGIRINQDSYEPSLRYFGMNCSEID